MILISIRTPTFQHFTEFSGGTNSTLPLGGSDDAAPKGQHSAGEGNCARLTFANLRQQVPAVWALAPDKSASGFKVRG